MRIIEITGRKGLVRDFLSITVIFYLLLSSCASHRAVHPDLPPPYNRSVS
jgi:hypothetical protein